MIYEHLAWERTSLEGLLEEGVPARLISSIVGDAAQAALERWKEHLDWLEDYNFGGPLR
jgi:hypothetical protein